MRIRTVKPDFFLHHKLYSAEREAKLPLRLSFVGLWCAADREGRFSWDPMRLGACILPYDKIDFSRVLDALTTRGFLEKHDVDGVVFGSIPGFARHQFVNPREKPSSLPAPPKSAKSNIDNQQDTTRGGRVEDAKDENVNQERVEGKGREGKGMVGGTPPKRFAKPTPDELKFAIEKTGLPESEVEKFLNHYEANGWRVGRNPMASWQHAVGNWAAGYRERNGTPPGASGGKTKTPPGALPVPVRIGLEKQMAALDADLAKLKELRFHERSVDHAAQVEKKTAHAEVIRKRLLESAETQTEP